MYGDLVAQSAIALFAALVLWAAVTDVRHYLIPNRITLGLLVLYPVYAWAGGHLAEAPLALAFAGIVLAIGAVAFACNQMGGGDVKLMAVCVLWAGPKLALSFIFVTLLAGGVIALALLIRSRLVRSRPVLSQSWTNSALADDAAPHKQNMPYGVAVAIGGLFVAASLWGG